MPKQYIEILVALIIVILSALGLVDAQKYPGESGYVPIVVLISSIILAVVWIGQSIVSVRRNAEALSFQRAETIRFAIFVGIAICYAFCFYLIGFYTSTFLMVPLVAVLLGYRRWRVLIPTAALFLVVLNLVFNLMLKTPLPPELLFRLKDIL